DGAVDPSPTNPKCRTEPWHVEGEDVSASVAATRIIPLQENPLPKISPFFTTSIDEIAAEYSRDGGRTWNRLNMPNMVGPGAAPFDDTRCRLLLNQCVAYDLVRGHYRKLVGRLVQK